MGLGQALDGDNPSTPPLPRDPPIVSADPPLHQGPSNPARVFGTGFVPGSRCPRESDVKCIGGKMAAYAPCGWLGYPRSGVRTPRGIAMILSAKAREDCRRGMTSLVGGDRTGALADFESALQSAPDCPEAYN